MTGNWLPDDKSKLDTGAARLEIGKVYAFSYQLPGVHRVPRWGCAKLIDFDPLPGNDTKLVFSGRPEFGTTDVRLSHCKFFQLMPEDTKPYMDRKEKR